MIHPKMKYTYAGVDSHKDSHTAVFLDCFYEKLGEITFNNIPSEFDNALKSMQKFKIKNTVFAFGLEDVTAYGRSLAAFLKSKNVLVKHANAALVASERKSRNILQKTDSVDAECAARVLLNRFDELPEVDPQDKHWILTNLVTRRKSLIKIDTMLKNYLHSLIPDNYPSYNKFFSNIDCKTSLLFFEKYPSPSTLKTVTTKELSEMLKNASHNAIPLKKTFQILEHVKKDGDTTSKYQADKDFIIQSTIRQIRANMQEIEAMDVRICSFLDNFDYKLTTMKGIDIITAAYLISEIGDIEKFPTPAKLARYAGVAPVTYASGKSDVQYSNQRGNRTLNSIFFNLALFMIVTIGPRKRVINPFFYEYYNRKIAEGKTKRQALKCIERRLVNIIWGMMKYKTEYVNPPAYDSIEKAE